MTYGALHFMDNPYHDIEQENIKRLVSEREQLRKQNAVLREALKNLVPLASIHQAQPENMTETDFYNLIVALSNARAALTTTEEKV